jgi:amino acid transporter
MNFIFFLIIALPIVIMLVTAFGGRRMGTVQLVMMLISMGVVLTVGVTVFSTLQSAISSDPNFNSSGLSFLFGNMATTPTIVNPAGQVESQQQVIPQPSSEQTSENKTIYLNSTRFNNDYLNWKNGK